MTRRRQRPLIGLAAALAVALLSFAADAGAIVGGEPSLPGRWPWMVAVLDDYSGDAYAAQFCGATVIAPDRVLTAGHCAQGKRPRHLSVLLGRTRLSEEGGRIAKVKGISVFRGYARDTQPGLDAAVLTLAHATKVPPLRLASAADAAAWAPGTAAWAIGWGKIIAGESPGGSYYYGDRLRDLTYPVVGDDTCERAYGGGLVSWPYRPAWNVCAGLVETGGIGVCDGDSGGPLVVADAAGWLQVGVVRGADACAAAGYPDVYTRVDRIRDFALGRTLTLQPDPQGRPWVSGALRARARLRCHRGRWAGSRARFAIEWRRPDGRVVGAGAVHRVTPTDVRRGATCAVTASNAGGRITVAAAGRRPFGARPRG